MNHPVDNELKVLEAQLRDPIRRALELPPSPEETALLLGALQPEFDQLREKASGKALTFNPEVKPPSLGRLLSNQFRLNHKALMLSGAAVFLMLVLLIDPKAGIDSMSPLLPASLFSLITPLMLMASILFSYRTWDPGMRMIESITPYPPFLVLFSRMITVIALIVGWAGLSSLIMGIRIWIAGEDARLPFGPFLLEWLGITLLTAGIIMELLFRKGIGTAIGGAAVLYVLWILFGMMGPEHVTFQIRLAAEAAMMAAGALLLLGSYSRSRKIIAMGV
ncbi:hypothetical protein [Paenibacillus caui]|uniref:hypothetical protein n=1 Tax=Paenibacillus caui TaxID=2873927 RepID=UPI001CA9A72A|nr:hypothetical protein [Paenibacillus caui]